ncbi:MAG: hypothetical protein L3K14_02515 [Thermoplasmata archaeon]|nr:hypothetical protein [Thermoplasmata archaeon]
MWMLTRRWSPFGWTLLAIVGIGAASFGTLAFAFFLSGLVTSPGTTSVTSLGSWGYVVSGSIAVAGFSLLIWSRQVAGHSAPTPAVESRPGEGRPAATLSNPPTPGRPRG